MGRTCKLHVHRADVRFKPPTLQVQGNSDKKGIIIQKVMNIYTYLTIFMQEWDDVSSWYFKILTPVPVSVLTHDPLSLNSFIYLS